MIMMIIFDLFLLLLVYFDVGRSDGFFMNDDDDDQRDRGGRMYGKAM